MDNELAPTLGGGAAEWPHKKTPNHKFVPPWRSKEMIDQANRELADIRRNHEEWLAETRRSNDQIDAMMLAFNSQINREPEPPTSGNAMRARRRWMGH